jgi:hypothetical protein
MTQEEWTLHHYAAMVERELEAYYANPSIKLESDWIASFKDILVFFNF